MLIGIHFSPITKIVNCFLPRMMTLYVASHYKNSPFDLQLMDDAPAHHLFVLLGPVDASKNHLPDILCVIQVSLDGQISHKSAIKCLIGSQQPFGDMVFPTLSGARIVQIATHPSAMRLGYAWFCRSGTLNKVL